MLCRFLDHFYLSRSESVNGGWQRRGERGLFYVCPYRVWSVGFNWRILWSILGGWGIGNGRGRSCFLLNRLWSAIPVTHGELWLVSLKNTKRKALQNNRFKQKIKIERATSQRKI